MDGLCIMFSCLTFFFCFVRLLLVGEGGRGRGRNSMVHLAGEGGGSVRNSLRMPSSTAAAYKRECDNYD